MGFWFGCWVIELLEVLLGWIFGAFAEEYRVLEDGCGHLLPVLRALRSLEVLSVCHESTVLGISAV
ncbi:hypothetical protein [Fictibacillus phosphorivorans]|uniref:hypothetical protein n=1 Tax=Fictibacillus phosphorivorans TaxID=1221500 RepID=UPI0012936A2C|nr:hypothetical protein [Fictibacillus phosphorivorans]MQR93929.1 hypothetical protein [Fictibacillus phosphorivorans]